MMIRSTRTRMLLTGFACLAVAATAGVLLRGHVPPADAWILHHWLADADTTAGRVAQAVSGIGTLAAVAMLAAVAVAVWRNRRPRVAGLLARSGVLLAVCAAALLSQAVFRRPGPPLGHQDWTYPSGHVVVVSAAAFTAVMLSRDLSRLSRLAVTVGAVAAIGSVVVSRMVLGEHYLLDVAGAVVVTAGVGLVTATALRLPAHRPTQLA